MTTPQTTVAERTFQCFVIMPFSDTEHGESSNRRRITGPQWTYIYEKWIKRAVESYSKLKFVCKRSPAKPGNFVKGIVGDLNAADLVIADLTGQRPNVYYELGIRHALRVGTIIITQDLAAVPSDLKNYYAFQYDYSDKAHEEEEHFRKFEKTLHDSINAMESSEDSSDSPVSDFLEIRHRLLERSLEDDKQELESIVSILRDQCNRNFDVATAFEQILKGDSQTDFSEGIPVIDVFPIEVLYTRLASYQWKALKPEHLKVTLTVIGDIRLKFQKLDRHLQQLEISRGDDTLKKYTWALCADLKARRKNIDVSWEPLMEAIRAIKLKKG